MSFLSVCFLFLFLLFLHWAEPLVCWIEEVRKNAGLVILSPLSIRLAIGLHRCNLLIIILRKWHVMSSLLIAFPFLIKRIGFCQILYLLRSSYGFLWKSVGMVRHISWFFFILEPNLYFQDKAQVMRYIYSLHISVYFCIQFVNIENSETHFFLPFLFWISFFLFSFYLFSSDFNLLFCL